MFDLQNIQTFLQGVNKFYESFERRDIKKKIVWQEGSTQIIDYTIAGRADLPALFLIPSIINKSYILDLTKDMSFASFYADLGYKVFLVSFLEPLESELDMGIDDYYKRLDRAVTKVCKESPVVTIGYCLGGVFSCALHSSSKANLIGQVLIATPWNFSHFKEILGLSNPVILQSFIAIVSALTKVSPSLVQWFFSAIDPHKIWGKFCQFSNMQEQRDIEKFVAIEQWVNDGISLSKKFALEALSILENNDLVKGKFITIKSDTPCFIIGGEEDKIVPPASYEELLHIFTNKKFLIKKTGHIGLVISKIAKEEVWTEIDLWIKNFRDF